MTAPGTAAPLGSVTTPLMAPAATWQKADLLRDKGRIVSARRKTATFEMLLMFIKRLQ